MIYPRFFARFLAWLGGYFWLPCPVCKENFAGFEADPGWGAVPIEEADGTHLRCVCSRPICATTGRMRRQEYMHENGWWFKAQ